MTPRRTDYPDRGTQVRTLAALVASQLVKALETKPRASLAVSGGTTPGPFLEALSKMELDWDRIDVTLTDERWVPEESERSNLRLLRSTFLKNLAAGTNVVSLYRPAPEPEAVLGEIEQALRAILPLDVCVLGMGTDCHIASLFPGGDRLEEGLAEDCPLAVLPLRAPGTPERRISLTAPVIRGAVRRHLLLTGEAKEAPLQAALHPGPDAEAPVRIVLGLPDTHIHFAL